MSGTKRQSISWFNSTTVSVERYFLFSSLALIVIFTWMEPVGTSGIGFLPGLIFWTIQVSILIPLLITAQHLISHYVNLRVPQAPWIQTAMSGLVAATLFVPVAFFLDVLFGMPEVVSWNSLLPELLDEASGVVVPVTITWLALNAPWILQLNFSQRQTNATCEQQSYDQGLSTSETKQPSRFLQELRSRAPGDLICISSELHYLRVTTTKAEVMFLYNLKDAIDELPSNSGVQVHRSHWVAKEHVKRLSKKDGNTECILSNGKILPVSRRKAAEVKNLLVLAS